jgi:hypothetical protein
VRSPRVTTSDRQVEKQSLVFFHARSFPNSEP